MSDRPNAATFQLELDSQKAVGAAENLNRSVTANASDVAKALEKLCEKFDKTGGQIQKALDKTGQKTTQTTGEAKKSLTLYQQIFRQATDNITSAGEGTIPALGGITQGFGGIISKAGPAGIAIMAVAGGLFLAAKAAQTAWSALTSVVSILDELGREGDESLRSEASLLSSLKRTGQYTQEIYEQRLDFSSRMSQALGVEDEALNKIQSILIRTAGVGVDQIERVTKAVLDWAAYTGQSADDVTKAFYSGMHGVGREWRRFGIEVSDQLDPLQNLDRMLKFVEKTAGGTAATLANTYGVALTKVKIGIGEIRESFGNLIARSPAILTALDGISRGLFKVQSGMQFKDDLFKPVVIGLLDIGVAGLRVAEALWSFVESEIASGLALIALGKALPGVREGMNLLEMTLRSLARSPATGHDGPFAPLIKGLQELRSEVAATSGKLKEPGSILDVGAGGLYGDLGGKTSAMIGFRLAVKEFASDLVPLGEQVKNLNYEWNRWFEELGAGNITLARFLRESERIAEVLQEIGETDAWLILNNPAAADIISKFGKSKDGGEESSLWEGRDTRPGAPGTPESISALAASNLNYLTPEMLGQYQQAYAEFALSWEASSWVLIGVSQTTATAIAAISYAFGDLTNSLGALLGPYNGFVMAMKRIQAISLLVTGVITLWKGACLLAESLYPPNPVGIFAGLEQMAKGAGAIAQAKQLGASGPSSSPTSSGGLGGRPVDVPNTNDIKAGNQAPQVTIYIEGSVVTNDDITRIMNENLKRLWGRTGQD